MEKNQRPCHKSVAQSASGHSCERGDVTVLMQNASHKSVRCSYRHYFLSLQQGREYTYGHIQTQNNQKEKKDNNGEDIKKDHQ